MGDQAEPSGDLLREVERARAELERVKREYQKAVELSRDLGDTHPDGIAALKRATARRHEATGQYSRAVRALTESTLPGGTGKTKRTILVVDDDPEFRARLVDALHSAGYYSIEAADGDSALSLLNQQHHDIDAVIVDLVLPGVTGFDIIGAISRRPNPIKVIATTGVLRNVFLEQCKYLGAHAVLPKPPVDEPFPAQQWRDAVDALFRAEERITGMREAAE